LVFESSTLEFVEKVCSRFVETLSTSLMVRELLFSKPEKFRAENHRYFHVTQLMKTKHAISTCLVIVCGFAAALHAQTPPLTPSGPPSDPSTAMKSLNQVEPRTIIGSLPYTISQPGSYYLTGNLTFGDDVTGITISANDVTLDLGGFTLQRTGSAGDSVRSIAINVTGSGVAIKNGHIDGAGAAGRYSHGITGSAGQVVVEGVTVRDCTSSNNIATGVGISLSATSRVANCQVIDAARGVTAGLVESCVLQNTRVIGGNVKNCSVAGANIETSGNVSGCTVTSGVIADAKLAIDCYVETGSDQIGILAKIATRCVVNGTFSSSAISSVIRRDCVSNNAALPTFLDLLSDRHESFALVCARRTRAGGPSAGRARVHHRLHRQVCLRPEHGLAELAARAERWWRGRDGYAVSPQWQGLRPKRRLGGLRRWHASGTDCAT